MYCRKITLFFISVLLSTNAFALKNDREQPILIESDKATIDNIKRVAIYEGDVIVTQGSIHINADTVTLNYTEKQDIEKVIAVGQPARFKQRLEGGDEIKAKARQMEYNAIKDTLHLTIEAELRKEKDGKDIYTSNAPRIIYDTQRGIIKADKGRVFVKIQPQRKSNPKK
jgi:lipopolysaccharide export system protein LptA